MTVCKNPSKKARCIVKKYILCTMFITVLHSHNPFSHLDPSTEKSTKEVKQKSSNCIPQVVHEGVSGVLPATAMLQ